MQLTPSDLCESAAREVERLGPMPSSARECVAWRHSRESAAIKLAELAEGGLQLLAQAKCIAAQQGDDAAAELLRHAGDWMPRSTRG